MATAEVAPAPRYTLRLAKAVLLLAAGAAAHVWLFPAAARPPGTPVRSPAPQTADAAGTAGNSTVQPGVASTVGRIVGTDTARRTVTVVVSTIRPAMYRAPALPSLRPAMLVMAGVTAPPSESVLAQPDARPFDEDGAAAAQEAQPQADGGEAADSPPRSELPAPAPPPTPMPLVPRIEPASLVSRSLPAAEHTSDERLVSAVLQQYRAAYERLDVTAARSVWPTVDVRALGAAFRQLAGQRVTFESCGVRVSGSGSQATARCQGQAEFMPKVGARRAYVASGEWVFDLAKQDTAWRIVNAEAAIK